MTTAECTKFLVGKYSREQLLSNLKSKLKLKTERELHEWLINEARLGSQTCMHVFAKNSRINSNSEKGRTCGAIVRGGGTKCGQHKPRSKKKQQGNNTKKKNEHLKKTLKSYRGNIKKYWHAAGGNDKLYWPDIDARSHDQKKSKKKSRKQKKK